MDWRLAIRYLREKGGRFLANMLVERFDAGTLHHIVLLVSIVRVQASQPHPLCLRTSLSQEFINIIAPSLFLAQSLSNLDQRGRDFWEEGCQKSVDINGGNNLLAEKRLAGEVEGEFDLLL